MSTNTQAMGGASGPSKRRKGYWERMGAKFLILSIVAHLLFFTGAAYFIIQIITPKKLTFKAGVPSTDPVKDVAEHKMSMAKKQKSMSAPAPAKRIETTGFAKISLPAMPEMPTNVVQPAQIAGFGGVGTAFGGGGQGGNGSGGGGNGGYMSPFGTTTAHPGMLVGQYYDFKYNRGGQKIDGDLKYAETILNFVKGGWHEGAFSHIYKGPHKLYATQIFFPEIDTTEGPKAFGCPIASNVGGKWVAVYRGTVSPPDSGTYYFVAAGDDDMIINFDGKEILNNCEHIDPDVTSTGEAHYDGMRNKFERSQPVQLSVGQFYEIRILIGDDIPRKMMAMVLWEKEGVNYQEGGGGKILPVFTVAPVTTPSAPPPPHLDGPAWTGKTSGSLMDMFDDGSGAQQ